jgi:hypothetical protein
MLNVLNRTFIQRTFDSPFELAWRVFLKIFIAWTCARKIIKGIEILRGDRSLWFRGLN